MTELSCPNCGASHTLANPGVISLDCAYCGSLIFIEGETAGLSGQQTRLTEGYTRLYTGAAGKYRGSRFVVLGRVRLGIASGFWDEWWIELDDGKTHWISEDDHELAMEREVEVDAERLLGLGVGRRFQAHGQTFHVEEIGEAWVLGVEGQLPRKLAPNEKFTYLDASSLDGRYSFGLEVDEQGALAFMGKWLKPSELELDDEGLDW